MTERMRARSGRANAAVDDRAVDQPSPILTGPMGGAQIDHAKGLYTVKDERGLMPVSQRSGLSTLELLNLNRQLLGGDLFASLRPGMVLRLREDAMPAFPAGGEAGAGPMVGNSGDAGQAGDVAAPSLAEVEGGAVLEEGMQGEAVSAVQKMLGVKQTGIFGGTTKSAVQAFQKKHNLSPVSGIVGATTLKHLKSQLGGISPDAAKQMERLVSVAESRNQGASLGDCFNFVWRYIVEAQYGKIRNHGDAPDMRSDYARDFADYMNSGDNAKRWGLRRLSLSSPYDAPRGAIVVVGPGTPGTRHAVAGDIAVAAGGGRFINDGPHMTYGPAARFLKDGGKLLGVYVPDV